MPQSFMGIGSGFDVRGMVDALMAIERRPILAREDRKLEMEKKKDAWRDVNTRLKTLKDKVDPLIGEIFGETLWTKSKATSADESIVKVTPGTDVATGTYDLRIRRLATSSMSKSSGELNTNPSKISSQGVVAGLDKKVDLTKSFAEAGFDTTPDGTVSIGVGANTWTSADLSTYSSVQAFIDAANANSFINMRYKSDEDKFIIESTNGQSLTLSQTGSNGFLTEANITTVTNYATNESGLDTETKLYKANFNNKVAVDATGSFKINGETLSWDADTDTLNGLIGKINRSQAGVTAIYDESFDKIMLTSKEMGANNIEVSDLTGTFAANTLLLPSLGTAGQGALFTINSTSSADEIKKDTNVFTIGGVSYDLRKISKDIDESAVNPYSSAELTKISVVKDEGEIFNKIKEFVDQFNSTSEFLYTTSKSSEQKTERGVLVGEGSLSSLYTTLFNNATARQSGLGQDKFDELSEIGITSAKYARGTAVKLEINETKLKEAIKDNPKEVENLFGKDTDGDLKKDKGVAVSLFNYLKPLTTFGGTIENKVKLEENFIKDLNKQIANMERNLATTEERYKKSFAAMDKAYATMNRQIQMLGG
ncbi:flagellar filament capping protein FliD [bacterium]|nr:flagellar filament capping protein FliD [bacterium]